MCGIYSLEAAGLGSAPLLEVLAQASRRRRLVGDLDHGAISSARQAGVQYVPTSENAGAMVAAHYVRTLRQIATIRKLTVDRSNCE